MYSSAPFIVGAVILAAVAALFLSPRTRRYGRVLIPVLIVVGFIGMGMHPAAGV